MMHTSIPALLLWIIVPGALIVITLISVRIFFDLSALRKMRRLGSTQKWYQRPTIINALGILLFIIPGLLNVAIWTHRLAASIFVYLFEGLILLLAFALISYNFYLLFKQRQKK